jgi:hypothetical protein
MMTMARRPAEYDRDYIRDISEAVYRARLGDGGAERMIEKDGDAGETLRGRAGAYDSLTRDYLRVIKP